MNTPVLVFIWLINLLICANAVFTPKIVCYFDIKHMGSENIIATTVYPEILPNPNLCSHLMVAFAKIDNSDEIQLVIQDNYLKMNDSSQPMTAKKTIEDIISLRQRNKDLKILLSIGGWYYNSTQLRQISDNQPRMSIFINNLVSFLIKFNFDGLDIYAENPSNRGNPAYQDDKSYLIKLIKELKIQLTASNLMLTGALPANIMKLSKTPKASQFVTEMAKQLDFMSIMAFDLNGDWMNTAVHHAPLYSQPNRKDITSIDDVVQDWLKTDIPREKLMLGLSTYGRVYKIKNQNDSCPLMGAPIHGLAQRIYGTTEAGLYRYVDNCQSVIKSDWDYKWLSDEKVPFTFSNWDDMPLRWAGFDDVRSFDAKVRYLMRAGFGGAMVFSIDQDDAYDDCNQGEYPLLRVVNFYLNDKLNIEFPDANRLFNLTWEKSLRYRDEQILLKTYMSYTASSKNTTMLKKKLCHCKRGVQIFNLDSVDKKTREIDCDDKNLENIRIEDDVKYDKRELLQQGIRWEHKLFLKERIKERTEQQKSAPVSRFNRWLSSFFN